MSRLPFSISCLLLLSAGFLWINRSADATAQNDTAQKSTAQKSTAQKSTAQKSTAQNAADEKATGQKASRRDRFKALAAEYDRNFAEFAKAFQNAKTEDERLQVNKRKPSDANYAKKFLTLTKESPADEVAYDSLLWIISNLESDDDSASLNAALDLFGNHHVNSPRLKAAIPILAACEAPNAESVLEKLVEKGDTRDIRGLAAFHLAAGRYERFDGKNEQSLAAIETLLDRVQKDFGNIQPDDEDKPLAKLAEGMLFEIRHLRPGKVVPELAGTDVFGKPLKLNSFRGKVVMLVFWGTWCGPCMAKVPFERKLSEQYAGRPFTVVGVNCGDPRDKAASVMKEQKMSWPSFFDGEDGPIVTRWNISSFPTIFLIDAKGVIRLKDPPDDEELQTTIASAVAEAELK